MVPVPELTKQGIELDKLFETWRNAGSYLRAVAKQVLQKRWPQGVDIT